MEQSKEKLEKIAETFDDKKLSNELKGQRRPDIPIRILLVSAPISFALTDVFHGYCNAIAMLNERLKLLNIPVIQADVYNFHHEMKNLTQHVLFRQIHSAALDPRFNYTHIGFIGGQGNCSWWMLAGMQAWGLKTFTIATEDPHQVDQNEILYRAFDYYFTNDKSLLDYKDKKGKKVFDNAYYLPVAASPLYNKILPDVDDIYKCDISFCGNVYPHRAKILEGLIPLVENKKYNFKVVGLSGLLLRDYPKTKILKYMVDNRQFDNMCLSKHGVLDHAHFAGMYNGSKININIVRNEAWSAGKHSTNKKYKLKGYSLNPRAYEICLNGGLQMIDDSRQEVFDMFTTEGPNQNIVVYNSEKDLIEKVQYYLEHEEERKAIARRGFEFVIRNHTYLNRASRLISRLYEDIDKNTAAKLKLGLGIGVSKGGKKITKPALVTAS